MKYLSAFLVALLIISQALAGCGGSEAKTTAAASTYAPYEQPIRGYWEAFNHYDLEKCLSFIAPEAVEGRRPGIERDLKEFEQGRMLGVKLLVDSVSPLVTLADGTLETRIVLKISPRGLADDRFLIYNLVQVNGVWKISRQYDDPLKSPPGTKPENLTAVSVTATQVKLTWESKSTRATGVRLERATDKAFKNDLIKIELAKDANGYTDTAVTPGATYYYRVSAFNVAGSSQPSSRIDVTIPAS